MARRPKILTSGLADHEAFRAWREVSPGAALPDRIEVIKQKDGGTVHRLPGVGPGGSDVIAKACRPSQAAVERLVYTEVLPDSGLASPQLHGSIENGPAGRDWLLLEDIGHTPYSPTEPRHRELAARWLGGFHLAASERRSSELPDRGPSHQRQHVHSLRSALPAFLGAAGRPVAVLVRAMALRDAIEDRWDELDELHASAPQTIVHGDCLAKNIIVRDGPNGLDAIPIDWGGGGRGAAGTCLGQPDLPRHADVAGTTEQSAYRDVVKRRWPNFDLGQIAQLAMLGRVFWALKVIDRELHGVGVGWRTSELALANIQVYVDVLDGAVRASHWYYAA